MNPDGTIGIGTEQPKSPKDRKVTITVEVTEQDLFFYPQYYNRKSERGQRQ